MNLYELISIIVCLLIGNITKNKTLNYITLKNYINIFTASREFYAECVIV